MTKACNSLNCVNNDLQIHLLIIITIINTNKRTNLFSDSNVFTFFSNFILAAADYSTLFSSPSIYFFLLFKPINIFFSSFSTISCTLYFILNTFFLQPIIIHVLIVMYLHIITHTNMYVLSNGRWILSSANSFCSSSVIIIDPVLTYNTTDQNNIENIVRTSLSNSMKSFGLI